MSKRKPNIYGIDHLDMFSSMIDGMLNSHEEQYNSISPALEKPHALDDYTVGRIFKVVGESKEYVPLYEKQLNYWLNRKIKPIQK